MNRKHVLAIQHVAFEDLGNLAPVLKAAGYSIEYIHASQLKKNRLDDDPALLIILGGPIGAYQEKEYPFLKKELDPYKSVKIYKTLSLDQIDIEDAALEEKLLEA